MTVKQALIWAANKLKAKKITSANLDAEVLLSHVLKKPREYLYSNPERPLSTYKLTNFKTLVTHRLKHEPVAYLTGHKEFYGLDFVVNKSVLVPRPETESLVEAVKKGFRDLGQGIRKSRITIADIGTGSGCIAIALAKTLKPEPQSLIPKIIATDKSIAALKVAKKNALKHKVKIQFKQGNLLEPVKNLKVDIIVANLPYLDDDMKNLLKSSESKALKFEPQLALKGGPDGYDIYRKFFKQLHQLKNKPRLVYLEM